MESSKEKNISNQMSCKAVPDINRALFLACCEGQKDAVKFLIRLGADVNNNSSPGSSLCPLYGACSNDHEEIVKLLISAGANVNKATDLGETPLHLACANNYKGIAEFLVKAGADVNMKDKFGYTAYSIAKAHNFEDIAKLFLAETATTSTTFVSPAAASVPAPAVPVITNLDRINRDLAELKKQEGYLEKQKKLCCHICGLFTSQKPLCRYCDKRMCIDCYKNEKYIINDVCYYSPCSGWACSECRSGKSAARGDGPHYRRVKPCF